MKRTLFLLVFYVAAAMWAVTVLFATSSWPAERAWGLAMGGASIVGMVGLRLFHKIQHKDFMRSHQPRSVRVPVWIVPVWIAPLAPSDQEQCESYVARSY